MDKIFEIDKTFEDKIYDMEKNLLELALLAKKENSSEKVNQLINLLAGDLSSLEDKYIEALYSKPPKY